MKPSTKELARYVDEPGAILAALHAPGEPAAHGRPVGPGPADAEHEVGPLLLALVGGGAPSPADERVELGPGRLGPEEAQPAGHGLAAEPIELGAAEARAARELDAAQPPAALQEPGQVGRAQVRVEQGAWGAGGHFDGGHYAR